MFTQLTGVWVVGPLDERLPPRTSRQINADQGGNATIALQLFKSTGELFDLDLDGDDRLVLTIRKHPDGEVLVERSATKSAAGDYSFGLVPVDTQYMGGFHVFDVWAVSGSDSQRVVDLGYFYVRARAFDPSGTPTIIPVSPGTPATQSTVERSFLWTWQTTGNSVVVTIPDTGMLDATYIVDADVAGLPFPEAQTAELTSDPATQSTTTLVLTCAAGGALIAGTTINIFLRDRTGGGGS